MYLEVLRARYKKRLTKTLRIMKITAVIMLSACLTASAKGYTQTVTLSEKNSSLQKVFKEIKRQTGYNFLYTLEQLEQAGPVTVEVRNVTLQQALDQCLQSKNLIYTIVEKTVVIKRKSPIGVNVEQTQPPIEVKGRVVNENEEPIAGASIKIKGTDIGTSTNDKGEFVIDVPDPNMILLITAVNIESVEVSVNARTDLRTIVVKTSVKALDAVIVNKGYYTTTQRLNTGTVSKVTSEEISKQPVFNPIAALQGRVPGLFIKQGNGLPGSNYSVLIRGRNSIQSGTEPLYIIDGVPFPSQKLTQRSQINANSPFNTINPLDIQSIEVLKDADATAIYGSRGANGVILITTKRGVQGKTKVDVNIYSGWGKITKFPDYLNTEDYIKMRREAYSNDGITPTIADAPDLLVWDTTRYTNWKKKLIGGTAKLFNSQINFSGGNSQTQFFLGANYSSETTVFPGDFGTNNSLLSLNLTHKSTNNKLLLQFTSSYGTNKSGLLTQDLTPFTLLPPNTPELYDSVGRLRWSEGGTSFTNPLSIIERKYNVTTDRLTIRTLLSYALLPKLNIKSSFAYNVLNVNEYSNFPIVSQDPAFAPTGSANFATRQIKTWIAEPQAEFITTISKGKFQALMGTTFQQDETKSSLINASGYRNDETIESTVGASLITSTISKSVYRYLGVFARLNYNWQDKYLVNVTARRDASSRFGPGKQFANFGSIGIGWIFTNERFSKDISAIINFGKLKGSIGISGNDQIGDYQFLDTWTGTQYPYQGQGSFRPTRLFNPDYRWEQIRKYDAGIDLGILNNRMSLEFNWFLSRSDNQIIQYLLPDQTGFSGVLQNFPGVVQNTGYEIAVNSSNIKRKHFEWNTSLNFTIAKNKLKSFPEIETSSYSSSYVIGQPLGVLRGYHFLGIDPATGIYQLQDLNQDNILNEKDFVVIGTTNPAFTGGLQNTFQFKQWTLDFIFQFVKQKGIHYIYSTGAPHGDLSNQPVDILNHWKKPNDNALYQKFTQDYSGNTYVQAYNLSTSDAILVDASYMRLNNLSLSYNLPQSICNKLKLSSGKLYFQGHNLITITSYKGVDPEAQSRTALPPLRVFTTGIQITL